MLIEPILIGNAECDYFDDVFVVSQRADGNSDEEDDLGEGGNMEEDEANEEESYDRGDSLEDEDEVLNDDEEEPYSRQDFPKEDQFTDDYDDYDKGKEFGENREFLVDDHYTSQKIFHGKPYSYIVICLI